MKTNQILETTDRELGGVIIRQRTKDEYFSLADIQKMIIRSRLDNNINALFSFSDFLRQKNIKQFMQALEKKIGKPCYIKNTAKTSGWIHPHLMLKMITHYNPEFEVWVYDWLWDYLVKYRIKGGDSYNEMCGVLYKYSTNKQRFHASIQKLAKAIKAICGVIDWNRASAEQLEKRELIHKIVIQCTESTQNSTDGVKYALGMFKANKEIPAETRKAIMQGGAE